MKQNTLLREFLTGVDARFPDDSSVMTMSDWIAANTRLKNRPFSFANYEFQRKIADDMHPDLTCIKCSQIGLTEVQGRKFFAFLKRTTGITGIFTLPNDKMRDRTSQTRFGPLVDQEPVFNQHRGLKPVRHKGLYQIDQSFGYVTGNTEGDATSIPADFLMHDELDLSDQTMIGLFQSRLQASNFKITQKFSTPTFMGYGIDASYKVSDQHEYMIRCESCNHWQVPLFSRKFLHIPGLPDDLEDLSTLEADQVAKLDLQASHVRCEKCERALDLANPNHRQWVAAYPSRISRGYRVRPFSVANIQIPYIVGQLIKMKAAGNLRGWYNTVLGEPYNDSNARLQESDIRAVMKGGNKIEVGADTPCFIGIDVGLTCHVVVGTYTGHVFEWLQVPQEILLGTVRRLLMTHNIIAGCMDRHPYTPTAEAVRDIDDYQNIIVPVEYRGSAIMNIVTDKMDQFSHVQANRTAMIDAVVNRVRKMKCEFSGYGHQDRVIIEHLMDMVRIELPDEEAKWQKLTGNDHYFHALAFMFFAMRYKDLRDYNPDEDVRVSVLLGGMNFAQQNASILPTKPNRSATIFSSVN